MRTTFNLFILLFVIMCGKLTYELIQKNQLVSITSGGCLSDIADEVVAIPLCSAEKHVVHLPRKIRKDGGNLFLISGESLLRFDLSGNFICAITDEALERVGDYIVNPEERQLIVLGNENDLFYFSYDGVLLRKKKLQLNPSEQRRVISAVMHQRKIWTTEEVERKDQASGKTYVCQEIVEYDASFNQMHSYPIKPIDLARANCAIGSFSPIIAIRPETEEIYAYTPSLQPDDLLRDTLYIQSKLRYNLFNDLLGDEAFPLLPVFLGERIWLSEYQGSDEAARNYVFCYDTQKRKAWLNSEGLVDDFYQTGSIQRLEAMDPYGESFCFCKSGDAVSTAFSNPINADSCVVFVAHLKVNDRSY